MKGDEDVSSPQFTDAILDKKTGMLHFNEKPVVALIAEEGIKVIPGGMMDICQLQVTFFIRSYGEVDGYGEALAKFKDAQKVQRERATRGTSFDSCGEG